MAQNSKSTAGGEADGKRPRRTRTAKVKQPAGRGTRIRLEPARREQIDPDMIALCYWLIAQRIVQEASNGPDATTSDVDGGISDASSAPGVPTEGTR
jgi:hypothetical protein